MKRNEFAAGDRVGGLIVVGVSRSGNGGTYWALECECGNRVVRRSDYMKFSRLSGRLSCCRECSTAVRSLANTRHGFYRTRLYRIWCNMKRRCKDKTMKHYGAKGIRVCREWAEFGRFMDWALANGYRDDLTIDRIDSDANYEPSNCRWVSPSENFQRASISRWTKYRATNMGGNNG